MHLVRDDGGYPEDSERHRRQQFTPNAPNLSQDFTAELIDAQQDLIAAQHQFLRDGVQTRLLAAQQRFLQVQTAVIGRLGVFG
jgi:hypothetical protein